ncbi:phosphate propanoyltransferase [Enterococcus avium]|uniref:phosphate propanoyltransferase n=1 Tax=Enterococcus malodoratus TaxID=71451 RepID=UPI0008AE7A43|nr:phosphate propanoyltransferase [Enterococcus malodoratus]BBM19033.1 phosphate propanoyltransferase [Enterococcus avium]SET90483.1 phosphate propanoyltransferase [Enterococcus malodoratus]
MNNYSIEEIRKIVREVLLEMQAETFPIGISNRHIHLTEEHFSILFPNESIEPLKPLKQPGEFASKQTVTLVGPKGEIKNVRILGPLRKRSQVEISKTDARNLGVQPPIRLSGHLDDAIEITIRSDAAELTIPAAIIAKRHIHLNYQDMERLNLKEGQVVSVKIFEGARRGIFNDVELRPGENFVLEMHVDTDEANGADIQPNTRGRIIRE